MIEDRLEQANKDAFRKRLRFLFVLAPILAALAAFLIFAERAANQTQTEPQRSESLPAETATPPDPLAREAFKNALKIFEEQIEPAVLSDDFRAWDEAAQSRISALKDEAISLFGTGEYAKATARLGDGSRRAEQSLAAREESFDLSFATAAQALAEDEHETAAFHIDQALRLKPDAADALRLKKEIAALPEILSWLRKAKAANAQNDPDTEYAALRKALDLDPARHVLRASVEALEIQINERVFAGHIREGLEAVAQRSLGEAKKRLASARALYPAKEEVALLTRKVGDLAQELEIERLVSVARVAAARDDWALALDAYGKAARIAPLGPPDTDGIAQARLIVELGARIDGHLQSPDRLTAAGVAKDASDNLARAQKLLPYSASLRTRAHQLAGLVDLYSRLVPVKVLSDGKTNISVRRVGIVGVTTEKTIELKPGDYILEGTRAGYRSKLVRINVPPGAINFQVEIRCDEQI